MIITLHIVLGIFLAELAGGLFHWFEQRYGNPDWPILGKYVVQPNIRHHMFPSEFCKQSYFVRNNTTMTPCFIALAIGYWFAWPLYIMVAIALLSQMNEIHSWAHKRSNFIIRFFQRLGLLQSPQHHHVHHEVPYNKYFCVMTNYMNPVLSRLKFWEILEWLVWKIIRVKPLPAREIY